MSDQHERLEQAEEFLNQCYSELGKERRRTPRSIKPSER